MSISLYLHIPFCAHRCAYCDFNTYAGQEALLPAYVQALCREVELVAEGAGGREVETIFLGGGTPSLLNPTQLGQILGQISRHFHILPHAEISLEANPGTVSAGALREWRAAGFNRISYGAQSADPAELRMLERIHTYLDVVDAVRWSRAAGIDNLNLDLMYGLPEQSLQRWQETLRLVLGLQPEHLSAYALTLEHGTPFGRWAQKGLLPLPDPDLAAEMYEWLSERLEQSGYAQYEISNWSKGQARQCRHNLQYWRNLNYLGLGAGAHGHVDGLRYSNVLRIKTYIQRMSEQNSPNPPFPLSAAAVNQHRNSQREDMDDTMMTGLRLTGEGVLRREFIARFGQDYTLVYGKKIERLCRLGLLEQTEATLRLTKRGRLLGNQVFMEFVGDSD